MGSSSGVIYAIIAVMWAVVLVPMWLRRHDEVTESRSVDRFQGAMRTLSRRDASVDRREVFVPRRPADTRAHADGQPVELTPAQQAARRRRFIVLVLAGATTLALVLGLVGALSLWVAAVPFVLVVGYVLQARAAIRREQLRAQAARRRRAVAARRRRQVAAAQVVAEGGPLRARPARPAAPSVPAAMPAAMAAPQSSVAEAASPAAAAVAEPEFYDQVAARAWDPVPVPVPTYVSAPKAPRSVRVIDLTLPGAWTSGRLEEPIELTAAEEMDAVAIQRDPIVTGEVLVERRRAVGD